MKLIMKEKRVWTKWFYWFTFAVSVIVIYKTLDNFSEIKMWLSNFLHVIMPFVIGIIIAYILYVPARKIENFYKKFKKIKLLNARARGLSIITLYIICVIALLIIINYIVPIIASSVVDFVNHSQDYYNIITEKISSLPDDSILKSDVVTEAVSKIGQIDMSKYINVEKLTEYAQGALSIATGIFNIFVSIIVSAYILLERAEILKFLKKISHAIFDESTCKSISKYFNRY